MTGDREGLCSFCDNRASTVITDDGGFYDACPECEAAWQKNPGFLTAEQQEELVARINANPNLHPTPPEAA